MNEKKLAIEAIGAKIPNILAHLSLLYQSSKVFRKTIRVWGQGWNWAQKIQMCI